MLDVSKIQDHLEQYYGTLRFNIDLTKVPWRKEPTECWPGKPQSTVSPSTGSKRKPSALEVKQKPSKIVKVVPETPRLPPPRQEQKVAPSSPLSQPSPTPPHIPKPEAKGEAQPSPQDRAQLVQETIDEYIYRSIYKVGLPFHEGKYYSLAKRTKEKHPTRPLPLSL